MAKTKLKATPSGSRLTADLQNVDNLFQSEFKSQNVDGCITSCFSFFNPAKIPRNYKNVLAWLVSIGEAEAKAEISGNPIDKTAITTAL